MIRVPPNLSFPKRPPPTDDKPQKKGGYPSLENREVIVVQILSLILCLFAAPAHAQLTLTGLSEMQRGEVPGADMSAFTTAYNMVNADYLQKHWQIGLRAEMYRAWGTGRDMIQITQKYARFTRGSTLVELGNYYAMLGRGLTLRAFGLPGVVLEDNIYRLRYSPTQDMEGAHIAWTGNRIQARALIGRPALSDVPPGAKTGDPPQSIARRADWVSGGELSVRPLSSLKIGGTAVHIAPQDTQQDNHQVWSALGELDLSEYLADAGLYANLYGEYARREGGPTGSGHYLSATLGGARASLSAEYKNYENMALRFNDPPSLVREHTALLLNRATHVLLPLNEKGYQIEGTYQQPGIGVLTANVSHGRNDLTPTFSTTFKERHIGLDLDPIGNLSPGLFFNWGKDDLAGINSRRIAGLNLKTDLASGQTVGLDLQHQRAARPFGNPADFKDYYTSLSWQHPKGFGAALAMDHTTDPFEADRPNTPEIETGARTFWSLNLNARIGARHDAIMFAGERRGGTACTSGTCYQVLPFKGVELRVNTHF